MTVELLGCLFTDTAPGGPPRGLYVVSGGVPPDAACVGAFVPNDDPRTVCLIYAHPTFPAVPTGSVVPRVTPTCRAKETPPEVSFEDARYVRGRWFPGEEAPA